VTRDSGSRQVRVNNIALARRPIALDPDLPGERR
jgi:hypothetical protein